MSLEEDARRLVIDAERTAREGRDPTKQKAALQPQYMLYLKALSRSARPKAERAEDYLRVITAMREEQQFAALGSRGDELGRSIEAIAGSPLALLDSYVRRLPGTVVLIIEAGTNVLTMFALLGEGGRPLDERVALERASKECVSALTQLLRQVDADLQSIARKERITDALFDPAEQAGAALWRVLPAPIRSALTDARTILYLPSAFGDLGRFPIEMLRTEDGWIGTTRAVARLTSIRTLVELVSPGRMPSMLQARAIVARARDSRELKNADLEAVAVDQALKKLWLASNIDREPRIDTMKAALDAGVRVLHYCGHGFAGKLGEGLPLAESEILEPSHFSQLSGCRTPFVYLSTCEGGQARLKTSGSAAGISTRLIEKGAPGVVGCLASVPDAVAYSVATAFYDAVATLPVGEALAAARKTLLRHPPVCWGMFACFGDPHLRLVDGVGMLAQTSQRTVRWDSFVGRHVALRSSDSRERALDAVTAARNGAASGELFDRVTGWLKETFLPAEAELKEVRLQICLDVAKTDAVAGCQLRMLLAMEQLQGSYFGPRKPDLVFSPEEAAIGLFCAKVVHDTLAWPAFAIEIAKAGGMGYEPALMLHMLDEALGMLEGWSLEEQGAHDLLSLAGELRAELVNSHKYGA